MIASISKRLCGTGLLLLLMAGSIAAQQTPPPSILSARPDYVLGPNDQIQVRSPQATEVNERSFRLDAEGFIDVPLIGRVKAGGLTVQRLEAELATRLREYVREPQVFVSLTQFRSEPVFFMGAFRNPGVYPLQGGRTLVEMLSYVGGLQPNASHRMKITRRAESGPIPLPNATEDREKKTITAYVSLGQLTENVNPEEDIVLQPFDIISVERAERVYVNGEVTRPSSIDMAERNSISVLQAISEAGGLTTYAKRDKIHVLREVMGTNRRAPIEIDLKAVVAGTARDFTLLPNDVLYVSRSGARMTANAMALSLANSLPYVLITALLR